MLAGTVLLTDIRLLLVFPHSFTSASDVSTKRLSGQSAKHRRRQRIISALTQRWRIILQRNRQKHKVPLSAVAFTIKRHLCNGLELWSITVWQINNKLKREDYSGSVSWWRLSEEDVRADESGQTESGSDLRSLDNACGSDPVHTLCRSWRALTIK